MKLDLHKKRMNSRRGDKAQSAMEYLMTYGWAILIIAVVLAVLFSLGVFSGGSSLPQLCTGVSGFLCSNATLSTSGSANVVIGQFSATPYYNVAVAFVPTGTATVGSGALLGVPEVAFTSLSTLNSNYPSNTLPSGVSVQLNGLTVSSTAVRVGTTITGNLWLSYTLSSAATDCAATITASSTSSCSFTQITSVANFKAT